MNKKLLKNALVFLTLLVLLSPVMVAVAADDTPADPNYGVDQLDNLDLPQPTEENALPTIVINLINLVLGFLALIAIVIVLIGGFEWMTAGGNDDKVKTAQNRLKYGLIGLVIIFVAYGLVTFVLKTLYDQLSGSAI
ncbi:hypothetical protein COX27_00905 [Candidatus Kuenenbacteria bacterium CG23_combo_of_CG06-09_8_20_14_all_36_9]|nr:MAG: hypothetical protein COX27_00905 [Candidatus Kuenenbacteria bacterium CG23_combo_of_CG06-09_8_20_14_all_36_9]